MICVDSKLANNYLSLDVAWPDKPDKLNAYLRKSVIVSRISGCYQWKPEKIDKPKKPDNPEEPDKPDKPLGGIPDSNITTW